VWEGGWGERVPAGSSGQPEEGNNMQSFFKKIVRWTDMWGLVKLSKKIIFTPH
jgi:hypothetical protein